MKKITWLHFSDLQLGDPKRAEESSEKLSKFYQDLQSLQEKHQLRPDLIFYTGDAIFGHSQDKEGKTIAQQWEEAEEIFQRVRESFTPSVPKENFFLVPGNHDVNRFNLAGILNEGLKKELQDQKPAFVEEKLTELIEKIDESSWQEFMKRLSYYKKFLETNEYHHLLTDSNRLIYAVTRDINDWKIAIAGFNSSWSSFQDQEKGKLWLAGLWQLQTLNQQFDSPDLKIALMHHPPTYFHPPESSQIQKELENTFDFFLHGQENQGWMEPQLEGYYSISAGKKASSLLGYNMVNLDRDAGKGEIHLRQFENAEYGLQKKQVFNSQEEVHDIRLINHKSFSSYLQSVTIENWKILEKVEVQLTSGVNVILGKNSFGKTSFLQAVSQALLPDENKDRAIDFEEMITFGNNKNMAVVELKPMNGENEELKKRVIFEKIKRRTKGKNFEFPFVLAYGQNSFSRYNKMDYDALTQQIVEGKMEYYHTKPILNTDYSDNFSDPLEILGVLNRKAEIAPEKEKIIFLSIIELLLKNLNILLSIPESEENSPESIEGIQICIDKNSSEYFFKDFSHTRLKLKNLSEGYKANLVIFSDIMIRLIGLRKRISKILQKEIPFEKIFEDAKGIILIDEFDRHLHPQWQKWLRIKLEEIFPKVQFILTTHNPLALLELEGEQITVFEKSKGKITVNSTLPNGIKDFDVREILLQYFGLDDLYGPQLRKKVLHFYQLKQRKKTATEEEEFRKLRKEIDRTFLDIPIHDFSYFQYLEFLRDKGLDPLKERVDIVDMTDEELEELRSKYKEYL